jgi:transcription antitermination factor NusA-like protein
VKSLICSFDAKSGVLCSKCEAKLRSGSLTSQDVEASIKLTRLAERSPEISKFTLTKAAQADGDLVLVLRSSDVNAIRSNPAISEKIENEFQRRVWFVESEASDRSFVESLFYPVRVVTVNLFWLPDGSKMTKIIASGSAQKSKLGIDKISKIAKAVRNMDLLVEFEQK